MPETPAQGPRESFVETFNSVLEVFNGRVKGAVVVKVRSFDRTASTAAVEPQVRRGATEEPVVQGVPVLFPGARWDVQAGEYGVLLTGALNWRAWWRTGQVSPVEDADQHGLSTGILLLGLTPQMSPLSIPASATVLEKPVALGTVRLGDAAATKAVVHEDFLADHDSLLALLDTWGNAVGVATGVSWAPVGSGIALVRAAIAAGGYQSPSVKVED